MKISLSSLALKTYMCILEKAIRHDRTAPHRSLEKPPLCVQDIFWATILGNKRSHKNCFYALTN